MKEVLLIYHISFISSGNREGPPPLQTTIKQEDLTKYDDSTSILSGSGIDSDISLLTPLKASKSYGTYSKQQQEDVIAFIKEKEIRIMNCSEKFTQGDFRSNTGPWGGGTLSLNPLALPSHAAREKLRAKRVKFS